MKKEIQLVQLREPKVCGLSGMGLKNDGNTIPKLFIFNHLYFIIIPLIILTCCFNSACGQAEQGRWSGVIEISEEYFPADVPKAIPDAGTTTSTLAVTDAGIIIDLNVKLNINHESNGNLDIYLVAPDGTRVELFTDVGGVSSNFLDTVLDNEAGKSITEGSAPFTDSYRPEGNLADLYGKDINGTWTLKVTDDWGGNTGTLNSWCLIAKLQVKGPVPSPVIQGQPSGAGRIIDTIFWNDVGEIYQNESNVAETIPDEGTLTSTLVIEDNGVIEKLNVKVNISHDWNSELDVYLIAPDGTRVELFSDVGGSQDDFIDTILDDEASLAITESSAPFTGSYRPKGTLSDLAGKKMQGTWVLEVTDDSWFGSGTLNSWTLTIDKADVLYYAECATDPDFGNIITNSGWMTDRSCTFNELDPSQEYWYRAKARWLQTWIQTSRGNFMKDTLADTDTKATFNDDVLLGSSEVLGPELNVIENPSYEISQYVLDVWGGVRSVHEILIGRVKGLWASDGVWAGCNEFRYDGYYGVGDYAYQYQSLDWTGVNTLVFDYASYFYGSNLKAVVLIGETEVWSASVTDVHTVPHYDVAVDVSGFSGYQELKLQAEAVVSGSFDAGIAWDNLRTYGPSDYTPFGSITSIPVSLDEGDTWEILEFNATIPEGTELTVDVLPETGTDPITGYDNVLSGTDLSGLGQRTIRLRANLSTGNSDISPVLHDWSVTYTDASCESEWSNVESSVPQQ